MFRISNNLSRLYKSLIFYHLLLIQVLYAAPAPVTTISPKNGSVTNDTRTTDDPLLFHTDDLSIPKPTILTWNLPDTVASYTFDLFLSGDPLVTASDNIFSTFADTAVPVWNLKINHTYFWRISIKQNNAPPQMSRVFSFTTPALWPRMIYLDGTTNVRDIGGRRTQNGQMIRQGLFYRSADFNMHNILTASGVQQLLDLGIRYEIDLRNNSEGASASLPLSVEYFQPASDIGGLSAYQYGLRNYPDQYRDVFKKIANKKNYPVIVHCWAGADRTATVAALLEAVLNCSIEHIEQDYRWTSLSIYGVRDTNNTEWKAMCTELQSYDTLNGTIQKGAVNYLRSVGLTVKEIETIRAIFLHPAASTENKKPLVKRSFSKTTYIFTTGNTVPSLPQPPLTVYDMSGRASRIYQTHDFQRKHASGLLLVKPIHHEEPDK